MKRAIVIGIGTLERGDDAAGRLVARALAGRVPAEVEVLECRGDATELLEAWRAAEIAIAVDCVVSGAAPGTLHRVDARGESLPSLSATSTHRFGLAEAIALGRLLGGMPGELILIGIEGARFEWGGTPCPEVAAAVERATAAVMREIEAWSATVPAPGRSGLEGD